jgi:hypothetical protein
MMNCEQATRMMSESQERDLAMSERTVLRMHKWICSGCRNFGGQLGFLRQAMKGFADRSGEPWPDGEPSDDKGGDQPPGGAV